MLRLHPIMLAGFFSFASAQTSSYWSTTREWDDGTDTAGSMWRRFLAPTSDSIVSFPSCFADEAGAVAVSNVVKIMKLKIPAKGGKIVIADGAAVTFAEYYDADTSTAAAPSYRRPGCSEMVLCDAGERYLFANNTCAPCNEGTFADAKSYNETCKPVSDRCKANQITEVAASLTSDYKCRTISSTAGTGVVYDYASVYSQLETKYTAVQRKQAGAVVAMDEADTICASGCGTAVASELKITKLAVTEASDALDQKRQELISLIPQGDVSVIRAALNEYGALISALDSALGGQIAATTAAGAAPPSPGGNPSAATGGDGSDDESSNSTLIIVVVIALVIFAAGVGVIVISKTRAAGSSQRREEQMSSFENPMYASSTEVAGAPAYSEPEEMATSGYMDVGGSGGKGTVRLDAKRPSGVGVSDINFQDNEYGDEMDEMDSDDDNGAGANSTDGYMDVGPGADGGGASSNGGYMDVGPGDDAEDYPEDV